jgi:beta-glucosidase
MTFRNDFVWGAATASYQVEGAATEAGKGPSIWDEFCRRPGAVWNGHSGEVACDHYRQYAADVGLMKALGLHAYRFSISWPRVMPEGTGTVAPGGLDFYDRLVDALVGAGIEPWVTLFHWDYPEALQRMGGWLSPDSPRWFADFTRVMVDRLSDRVRYWMTLNEPQVFVVVGHSEGRHAPGLRLTWPEVLQAWHHTLLAHGLSVQAIRGHSRAAAQVGAAPVFHTAYPATDSSADIEAARQVTFAVRGKSLWAVPWYLEPVLNKRYPPEAVALFEADLPAYTPSDLEVIAQPLDFFGFNHYHGWPVRAQETPVGDNRVFGTNWPLTTFQTPVTPDALYWGSRFLSERIPLPLVITENGMSNLDWVHLDGKVHDPQRTDFTRRYLQALRRAAAEGIDVRGYFHWSLMDNFEWAEGYRQRFGLTYVDFQTQQRIPKDSFEWYRQVIATNGESL